RSFMDWLTNPVRKHCDASAYEHSSVTLLSHVTVSALLRVWGAVRAHGKRAGDDDAALSHCKLAALDDISGVPGLGRAMSKVGWAVQCGKLLIFPNFLKENSLLEEVRQAASERQKRSREKDKNRH